MIIKTMQELGKAIDEERELQTRWLSFKESGLPEWRPIGEQDRTLFNLKKLVTSDRIRIKPGPEYIWVNVRKCSGEFVVYAYKSEQEAFTHNREPAKCDLIEAHKIELPEADHE